MGNSVCKNRQAAYMEREFVSWEFTLEIDYVEWEIWYLVVNVYAFKFHIFLLQAAISMLKQEYNEDGITLNEALKLAVKVLSKTLDVQKLTSEKGNMIGC